MKRLLLLISSHVLVGLAGFAGGIYALPLLIAPSAPGASEIRAAAETARFTGVFRRDLQDSDALHWGEGEVYVSPEAISLDGEIAPGPAYKLYLSPEFIETEADFKRLKPSMALIGDVKTFENFMVPVPRSVDPAAYNTVVIWCESFSQFITAARYQ